jgi:hypothetical protein
MGQSLEDSDWLLGAPLPEDASNVYFCHTSFFGNEAWLRFDLPPEQVQPNLDAMDSQVTLEIGYNPLIEFHRERGAELGWWHPGSIQGVAGGYYLRSDAEFHNFYVAVDTSDPALWRVYIYILARG